MMKLSELIAARCRRPRFFAIAIALGAAAALAASAEAGTGPATAAAITNLASYRALSAAASLRIFRTVDGTSVYPRPVSSPWMRRYPQPGCRTPSPVPERE